MKPSKVSKSSSHVRNRTRTVKMTSTAHGLTSQAGLIPVVKYLDRIGFEKTVKQSVPHRRGENADHHLSDVDFRSIDVGWHDGGSNINGKGDDRMGR